MPVPKLCTSGTLNPIKSEGNDSLDNVIRQAIGKDPLLPFSRTGDNSMQWIQLLHALDQPDLPGWPLMTPIKVQMHKCEKCTLEFCSLVNYRRHVRVHRRSLNINKESHKHRDLLAAFWDKLSVEEAKEVVSFNDVMLKEIPGSSVIGALASFLHQPGVWTLPQFYVMAGSTLLDIIQAKPSRLPISSRELFNILDDASERTFLCAGTAESVQKYLFDGDSAKSNLELKNLVACTSFLFERKLVKAWVADKDAEALRCQKLLVEEEEAAQKRQVELLERKKQKKIRRKEQKVKEQIHGYKGDLNVTVVLAAADESVLGEASLLSSPSNSSSSSVDMPRNLNSCAETMLLKIKESEKDIEAQIDFSSECINPGHAHTFETQMVGENGHRHLATNRWQVSKSQRGFQYGSHRSQNHQNFKPQRVQKVTPSNDRTLLTGSKVWTEKHKMESDGECLKPSLPGETSHQMEETNCQVVIGSIPITVRGCSAQQKKCYSEDAQDTCGKEPVLAMHKKNALADTGYEDSEDIVVLEKVNGQIIPSEGCMSLQSTCNACDDQSTYNACDDRKHCHVLSDDAVQENMRFSSVAAKEFLMRRWKEAISTDHVKLVFSSQMHGSSLTSTA